MTAFLQGISQFVPEIQPYQPDLNFFSNMLQAKQYQYDQGYNRVNSIYAGLLNSPVLRNESAERRDQFFKDIEQKIQKISTMDLSLEQNVGAAAKIFQPLIDDKDINFDMGMTRIYQREMQKGERLKNTTDPKKLEEMGMWWDGGSRALNYWAQDFSKTSAEDMYKMPRPEYVPYFNVAKMASDQLEKMKFPLGFQPFWSPDGRFIIQGKGGPAAMAPLYNYLLNIYGNDPRIAKVVQTEAYLQRKDYIAQNASTMGEQTAESQYLNDILNQVNEQAKMLESNANTEVKVSKASTKIVQDALENGDMFDPNRALAEIMGINAEQAAVNEQAAQFHSETLKITNPEVLQASDFSSLRNRVDSAVAREILSSKLYNTARDYAELNKEIKIEADPYAKAAFENALERSNIILNAQLDEAKMKLAAELDISKMQYEYYLKDYYGIGDGSGKGKGNNGVDDVNPNRQDGFDAGGEGNYTEGGEGTDAGTERLTAFSIKELNENAINDLVNQVKPQAETYNATLDKLYELSKSGQADEATVARNALAALAAPYATNEEIIKFKNGQDMDRLWNFFKSHIYVDTNIGTGRGQTLAGFGVRSAEEQKREEAFDKFFGTDYASSEGSDYADKVKILKSQLSDPAVRQILSAYINPSDVSNKLDLAGVKSYNLISAIKEQAANESIVRRDALKAIYPLTSTISSVRLELGDDRKLIYNNVDPEEEFRILSRVDNYVNQEYKRLKQENPKGDAGDLWDDAVEMGKNYYVNSMMDYYMGPRLKEYSRAGRTSERSRSKLEENPIYNWNGEQVKKSTLEGDFIGGTGYNSKLQDKIEERYENYSNEFKNQWNTNTKVKTWLPTLHKSAGTGGGLASRTYTSDIDGAYYKNPGNSDFAITWRNFKTLSKTVKPDAGAYSLFTGKISADDDLEDILEKGVSNEAFELLTQLNIDMTNAGAWKNNQMTRPRALMYTDLITKGSDKFYTHTFRIDGGYVKGLKESASKELTQEEQASESSSSSLSDARYITLVVPADQGTTEFTNSLKADDPIKTYVRNMGYYQIDYNNTGQQKFSGSAKINYNNGSYNVSGQINTFDPNTGQLYADPQGVISGQLTDADDFTIWSQKTNDIFDARNNQIINDMRIYYSSKKNR